MNRKSRSPVLGGGVLRVVAEAFGVPHSDLARGVSRAQVEGYIQARHDVSEESAERIWTEFFAQTIGLNNSASREVAQTMGALFLARTASLEAWATALTPVADHFASFPEAALPWLWMAAIELALQCAVLRDDEPHIALAPTLLAAQGFGTWLHEQCTLLRIEPSPAGLAAQTEPRGTRAHEALRKRYSRYLNGEALPRGLGHRVVLVESLAKTRITNARTITLGRGVQLALLAAHAAKLVESRAPGYASVLPEQFAELRGLLATRMSELPPDTRGRIFRTGGLCPEAQAALSAVGPQLSDLTFRRVVAAYAKGRDGFIAHVLGGYFWLGVAASCRDASSKDRGPFYTAFANPNPLTVLSAVGRHLPVR